MQIYSCQGADQEGYNCTRYLPPLQSDGRQPVRAADPGSLLNKARQGRIYQNSLELDDLVFYISPLCSYIETDVKLNIHVVFLKMLYYPSLSLSSSLSFHASFPSQTMNTKGGFAHQKNYISILNLYLSQSLSLSLSLILL